MKKRKAPQERINDQLYVLLSRLSPYIENRDTLGSMVGYCVASSLVDFKKKPGSNSNFEEARTVYEGLETVIIRCSADLQETANPDTNRLYAIFCEFQIKVNSHVDKVRADHHIDISEEYQSSIIRGMLNILKYTKENPEDWLRRRGIALIHEAMAGGEHKGAKNALTEDYNALTYSFTAR